MSYRFDTVNDVRTRLQGVDYLSDDAIAGIVYLADRLGKPILVEGPAGTGKTQLAKSVAEICGARLIRLQCYEGLDESKALYEWNYKKQLLRIQATKAEEGAAWEEIEEDIFSDDFLLACAGNPQNAFLADNNEQLEAAFRNIATSISRLRIAR